ncbi:MAG: hypothetical protein H0U89_04230 [Acidimicrobiia bacterium]|nr:hypothetical protein [Acidimicrobiia bacterium]
MTTPLGTVVGLDFGKHADYTALCVVQAARASTPAGYPQTCLQVRHLERYPLGTSYSEIADRVAALMSRVGGTLLCDSTGVGSAAVDMLRERGVPFIGISIHGGTNVSRTSDGYSVPKAQLVGALATALEQGALKVAKDLPLGGVLAAELATFKRKQSRRGHVRFEHGRASEHDDLLMSLCLATWGVSVGFAGYENAAS